MIDPVSKAILHGLVGFYEAIGSMGAIRAQYDSPVMRDVLDQYPELVPDLRELGVI